MKSREIVLSSATRSPLFEQHCISFSSLIHRHDESLINLDELKATSRHKREEQSRQFVIYITRLVRDNVGHVEGFASVVAASSVVNAA